MGELIDRAAIHVDGAWIDSTGAGRIEVVDPATEKTIAVVAAGTADDVDRAAAAARSAVPHWSARSGIEWDRYLRAAHDVVSFTGSTTAGKRVAVTAAGTVKKVAFELGGKSAFVILDDADLESAVPFGVARCMRNSGQTCSALTRMLVPEAMIQDATRIAVAQARNHPTGDPTDPGTVLGPLVSAAQRDSVLRHIDSGIKEGATLALDGRDVAHGAGYFVGATVFSDVTADMTTAREEIFGPVLVIMGYRDEAEAVRLANDTDYGLAAAVW